MEDDELAAKEELELWLGEAGSDEHGEPVEPTGRDVPIEMIELERVPRQLWK